MDRTAINEENILETIYTNEVKIKQSAKAPIMNIEYHFSVVPVYTKSPGYCSRIRVYSKPLCVTVAFIQQEADSPQPPLKYKIQD